MRKNATMFLLLLAIISVTGLTTIPLLSNAANSVLDGPKVTATITGATSACEGSVEVVYSTDKEMKDYLWVISAGGIITSRNNLAQITVSWLTPGDQVVSVSYSDPLLGGELIEGNLAVVIDPLPSAAGEVTGPNRVCAGESELVYSIPPIQNATKYNWLLPNGATILNGGNTNTIKVEYSVNATSGNIVAFGTNDCGDGVVSWLFPVTIHEIPSTPNISLNENILISTATEGNQWFFEGTIIPGATRQDYEVTQSGRYWSVVSLGGCSSAPSNKMDVNMVQTGINNKNESSVQIYPVPNNGQFTIKCDGINQGASKILVYNNLGMTVFEKTDIPWDINGTYSIDLHAVPMGTYAVVIENGKQHMLKKMLITR
jgi:hypothetical protein